jgi:hypothetical protein
MVGEKLLPGEERCYCWNGHGELLRGMGGGAVRVLTQPPYLKLRRV